MSIIKPPTAIDFDPAIVAKDKDEQLQVSRRESDILTIINLYEPDQREWINYCQRRL